MRLVPDPNSPIIDAVFRHDPGQGPLTFEPEPYRPDPNSKASITLYGDKMRDPYAEALVERDRLASVNEGLRDFMKATGRSDRNPYGDQGVFGSKADYSGIMTPQQIADINRIAYEQAQGLISGRGFQGRGMDAPQVGYAPALKIGSSIPGGTVQLAPQPDPEPTGVLGGLGSFLKGGGIIGQLLGGGNRPRVFQPDPPAVKDTLLNQVNEKANQISNQQINGGITGAPIGDRPSQVKSEDIPGAYQTVGLDSLGTSQFLPEALRDILIGAGKFAQDGGPSVGGNLGKGRYEIDVDPFGQNKGMQFNYEMPLQDFGIGKLFSQNMDPRRGFTRVAGRTTSVPPDYAAETDAEFEARMDRMFGEQYERDRARKINRAMIDNYLQSQSDVGVYTPPASPPPKYDERPLATMFGERGLPEQFGGFADPLLGLGYDLYNSYERALGVQKPKIGI